MELKEEEHKEHVKEVDVEQMLPYIGEFGRYQKLLCLVLSTLLFPLGMQVVFSYFATLTPSWRCTTNSTECTWNGTFLDRDERRCRIPPHHWTYTEDTSFSITTEYQLHCQRKWILTLIMSMFFVGWGVGAIVIGPIADRYGRKKVIMPCFLISLVVGIVSPFIPNVYVLICSRFVIGFAFPGVMIQNVILITEFVGNAGRPVAKMTQTIAIQTSWMMVALQAYLLQNWKYLSLLCTLPYVFCLLSHFFIPESVRWLHLNNHTEEAMAVLHNVARWNKTTIPPNVRLSQNHNITVYRPKSNIPLLFKTKGLAVKSCVQLYIYMAAALLCYGLQFAAKKLGGSLYLNFVLLAAVSIPASLTAAFVNKVFGRKIGALVPFLLGGIICVAIAWLPEHGDLKVVRVVLGILGKMCGTVTFLSIYIWCAELYPTDVRAVAMGLMQVGARVGSAASPFVLMELGRFGGWIPFVVIAVVSLIAAGLGMVLPETKGTALKETLDLQSNIKEGEGS